MTEITDEMRYRLLKVLAVSPSLSQRDLAALLGISLGRVNYCLRALVKRGLIKARNFKNSRNKIAYMYYLTPAGAEEKIRVTYRYLKQKVQEAERLEREIELLRQDAARQSR